jgi:DNA-binding response OmpR family regulator
LPSLLEHGRRKGIEQNMMSKEDTLKISRYDVLVVDDEEGIRKLVATLLSQRGHHCLQAVDGTDALYKTITNKFDAVITDIVMPKMDGIALTRELLKRIPRLPIMVMTAHDKEFSSVTAMAAGAKEFIKKPFSLTEFGLRFQKMMSDYELFLQIVAKQEEMLFQIQKRSVEEITELKREIESLKNRLCAGYPRFNR